MASEVEAWVKKLDLPAEIAATLVSNGFDTLRRLSKIKSEDCTAMGFKLGHAREILEAVPALSELRIEISSSPGAGASQNQPAPPASPSTSRRALPVSSPPMSGSSGPAGSGVLSPGSEERKLRLEPALTTGSRVLMQRRTLKPLEIKSGELCLRITKEGELQSMGTAAGGFNGYIGEVPIYRLGHPDGKAVNEYTAVPKLKGLAVRHACVDKENIAAFAVTATQLFTWGGQQNHVLGLGRDDPVVSEPTLALDLAGTGDEFVMVDAGQRHAAALTVKGVLYTWGMNNWGAGHASSGSSSDTTRPSVPQPLKTQHIVYIVCTDGYGDGTLAVNVDGQVLRPKYEHKELKPDEQGQKDKCAWVAIDVTMEILRDLGFTSEEQTQIMRHVKRASMASDKRKTMPAGMLHAALSAGGALGASGGAGAGAAGSSGPAAGSGSAAAAAGAASGSSGGSGSGSGASSGVMLSPRGGASGSAAAAAGAATAEKTVKFS